MLLAKAYRPDPRVYKEAMTLSKNGFKVFILCWDREAKYAHYKKEMSLEIFQFHFLRIKNYNLLKFPLCLLLFNILCVLWAITRRIDYVHSNDFDTLPAGYAIRKIKVAKLVYDAHESYVDAIAPHVPQVIQTIVAVTESLLIRKADSVITENENKKSILIKRGASKVHILPNYPMVSLFRDLDQETSKRALGVEEKFVVLYIGEVMPGRNLELLVDLAYLLNARGIDDIVFLIVGDGVLLPQLKEMVKIQKLSSYFVFVEWVSPKNVPLYYAASDIVYILLEREPINIISMPNKLFEAIASGKTVLASDFGKIAEVVKDTECGFLCTSMKADEVLDTLIYIKDNPDLRQIIRKRTAEIEQQVHAWEKVDHILTEIYV
jgi:glycosyltransferase involved in cell wall biosynthesis